MQNNRQTEQERASLFQNISYNWQQSNTPTINLPKGGGSITGMGEKFQANPVTGTVAFSVPVKVSPGRSGFGPQLNLNYDSGIGNSEFGLGWKLDLPTAAFSN